MDRYKELIKELRKYFYDEPLVMDAADAIEHLLIESNNYRKALEAMAVENGRQKAEIKKDNEICKKCYESRVLAETRATR